MRDPSKFRERVLAYKNGKSVREIYGLPGYAEGEIGEDPELDLIKKYEGWRDATYLDSKGIPTIGWGFTDSSLVERGHITRKEGDAYLSKRVAKRKTYLRNKLGPLIWDNLSTGTRAALLSYDHNYPAGFDDNTRFMRYWRAGNYDAAVREIDAGMNDASSPGLRTRRLEELAVVRKDPFLFPTTKLQILVSPFVAVPDNTRVATMPTVQQLVIDRSDRRNSFRAEAERAMWADQVMLDILGTAYQQPIYKSEWLPLEYDITDFKPTGYKNGKLPGYQWGKAKEIKLGRKLIPIDKAESVTEPDYNEGWFLTTIKRGVNKAIKTAKDQVRAVRNIINGRGTFGDYVEVGLDALTGAAGKLLRGSAKEAKQVVKRTLKPTKASTKKFDTRDPNKVGVYYSAHPEEVTPLTDNLDVRLVVNFMNNHVGPKYAKLNGIHVGIDPNDINIGYADLSGSGLGGYVGPSGEVVINKDILNNRDKLRYVLGHEIAGHWFDLHYPLTVPQMSTVGYAMPFHQDFLAERPWFNAIKEANAERRAFLFMTYFDKGILGNELDQAIKDMPRAEAKRYIDQLGYARGIDWQWPDILPFKQAATSVPTIGLPLYAGMQRDEYKNGKLPRYNKGKTIIGSNVSMNDDDTFTDDYTRAFDDLIITPKGARVKPGELYKYQEPWDSYRFYKAITLGGIENNVSPSNLARKLYDTGLLIVGNKSLTDWTHSIIDGNTGIVPTNFALENPYAAMAANGLFDLWTLGGYLLLKLPFSDLSSAGKVIWNNGKMILNEIPIVPGNFYRMVRKDAIQDAKNTGIIRGTDQYKGAPYFSQSGMIFKPVFKDATVIEGTPLTPVQWTSAFGNGVYKGEVVEMPIEMMTNPKPSDMFPVLKDSRMTNVIPWYNESYLVPTTGFSYWQKHPLIGWRRYQFNPDLDISSYKDGKIAIKSSKRGTFTAAAKKHGASVKEFESRVLKNPEKYSKAMVKKARFSRNARSWKH